MCGEDLPIQVFRQQVRRVLHPRHFPKPEFAIAQALLDPELSDGQVPDSPNARPTADPNRGRRVRPQPDGYLHAKVAEERLLAQSNSRAFDDAVELGLTRRQRNSSLSCSKFEQRAYRASTILHS